MAPRWCVETAGASGVAGGLPERKPRQIMDAIRNFQWKNALKMSSSLITKYPNSPYAHTLKALCLETMGKRDEALSTCLKAKELLHVADDSFVEDHLTLTTMGAVFTGLGRLDLTTSCYEYACTRFPTHFDCLKGLFDCYAREYSYDKQQQVGFKLYRMDGDDTFLFSAICCIQIQVYLGHGGENLLAVAEEELETHIAAHSLHKSEDLMVYLSVLEQQGKYWKALDILSGELGSLFDEVERLLLQGRLLALAGYLSTAARTFKQVLESRPDDWQCFLQYLACLLEDDQSWCNGQIGDLVCPPKLVTISSNVTVDELDSRMSEAMTFVNKLRAESSDDAIKCPYLARLEIERRKYLHKKVDKKKLVDLLVQYYFRFGHMSCFCSDVEMFLEVLDPNEQTSFVEKLMKDGSSLSVEPIRSFAHSVTHQKIQELTGNHFKLSNTDLPVLKSPELQQSVLKMLDMFDKNLHFSKNISPKKKRVGEELLSMASNMLVQLYWRTMRSGYLVEAVMVLELGLTIRKSCNYKILLIHLYCHLGALPAAYDWYMTDGKIQLPHLILPQMLVSPFWADLNKILDCYLMFVKDPLQQFPSLIFTAYDERSYTMAIRCSQYKDRLKRSAQYLMARIESMLLRLKKAHNIEEEESALESCSHGITALELANDTACDSLTFDEDFGIRPWWTPTPDTNYLLGPYEQLPWISQEKLQEFSKGWEINVKKTMKKRSFLPRMIYLSLQTASNKENTGPYGTTACGHSLSLELKSLLEQYSCVVGVTLNEAVDVLTQVFQGQKSLEAFGSYTVDWVNLAVFINALTSQYNDQHGLQLKDESSASNLANTILESAILDKLPTTTEALDSFMHTGLPMLVQLITEPLSWHIFFIQSCARSCSGKKKRKGGSGKHAKTLLYNSIRDSINTVRRVLEAVIKWLKEQIDKTEGDLGLDRLFSTLDHSEEGDGRPGLVFGFLSSIAAQVDEDEVGDQIGQAMKSWDPVEIARKIASGQSEHLSNLLGICGDKLKSLEALKFPV